MTQFTIGLEQATYTRTTPNDMGELKPMQMPWLFKQNDKTPLPKGEKGIFAKYKNYIIYNYRNRARNRDKNSE